MWRNLFILYFVFVKKQSTIERKKKRSKISRLESCYANRIYVLIGVELRPYGQKLVQFCKHTHTRVSFSSIDEEANDCGKLQIFILSGKKLEKSSFGATYFCLTSAKTVLSSYFNIYTRYS